MNSHPSEPPKDFSKDLKAFAQLPARTKELSLLKDQAEKATGQEGAALTKVIREKSTPEASP